MLHPVSVFIALRYLRTKRKNRFASFVSVASVLGVGLGVAVLIIVTAVMNGFEKEVKRHILGMTSHAVVLQPGAVLYDWSRLREDILTRPHVAAAAPFIRAGAMLNHRGNVRGVSIQGVDLQLEHTVSTLPDAVDPAAFATLADGTHNILLGKSLAEALEVETGDTITLVAPRWRPGAGIELPQYYPLTVTGTFSVGMHDFDAGFALLSLADAASMFELGEGISGLRLRFDDADAAPFAARAAATALGEGATAVDWTQYHRNFFLALKSQKRIMFVILSLIVAVAAFNIVASMIMVVKEKTRDIAVLRTLGLSRRATMFIFVVQGIVIGASGVALGIVLGALGASRANEIVGTIERLFGIQFIKPDVYYINYLPADLRFGDITTIAAIGFVICVIATLYPAAQAARTAPAAALRYE